MPQGSKATGRSEVFLPFFWLTSQHSWKGPEQCLRNSQVTERSQVSPPLVWLVSICLSQDMAQVSSSNQPQSWIQLQFQNEAGAWEEKKKSLPSFLWYYKKGAAEGSCCLAAAIPTPYCCCLFSLSHRTPPQPGLVLDPGWMISLSFNLFYSLSLKGIKQCKANLNFL